MNFIVPDWPVPAGVHAATTVRDGGVSRSPYDSLNLAMHVGDEPGQVRENRRRLRAALQLPAEPLWLNQVHGTRVLAASEMPETSSALPPEADAVFATGPGLVCAVLTADCLPVLFVSRDGTRVAAAHAGWRGLSAGVIEATIEALAVSPADLIVWLGPAIGSEHFEVGEEVRAAFMREDSGAAEAFVANERGRWLADLYRLARRRLQRAGVRSIHGDGHCSFRERAAFFSHRRDGVCGRFATLIWIA